MDGRTHDTAPAAETGQYLQSLALACQLTRLTPDLDLNVKYKAVVANGVHFLTGLQYTDVNTRHFETTFRVNTLIGGFHLSPTDGNLHIDATANAITGLTRFVASARDK
jgi:hypothetical protein